MESQALKGAHGQSEATDCHNIHVEPARLGACERNAITFRQAENFLQGVFHAEAIGTPLNYHLCVRWLSNDWRNRKALVDEIRRYQAKLIGRVAFVWVNEGNSGPHTHLLLHYPPVEKPSLDRRVRRLVARLSGLPRPAKYQVKFCKFHSLWERKNSLRFWLRYLLKAADQETRSFFRVDKREEIVVRGKRIGMAQSLNETARQKSGGVRPSGLKKPTREMLEKTSPRRPDKRYLSDLDGDLPLPLCDLE
ncbi:MAG: hypothetical protein ACPGOV_02125 [Magnetovibrionaceae bacterium]